MDFSTVQTFEKKIAEFFGAAICSSLSIHALTG